MGTRIELDDRAFDAVVTSLQMRICYMETGEVHLRASDAINSGRAKLVKPLSKEQRDLIACQEQAINDLLRARSSRPTTDDDSPSAARRMR